MKQVLINIVCRILTLLRGRNLHFFFSFHDVVQHTAAKGTSSFHAAGHSVIAFVLNEKKL